jgi:hypothetical protein
VTLALALFLLPPDCASRPSIDAAVERIEKTAGDAPSQRFFRSPGNQWTNARNRESLATATISRLPSGESRVEFSSASDSGDWVEYSYYFYDRRGRLLRLDRTYNTTFANSSRLERSYFDCAGRLLHKDQQLLSLDTKKPLPPGTEDEAQPAPLYLTTRQLPFPRSRQ